VVAAPGGNPEYQFHWTRDAAITMHEVMVQLKEASPGRERERLREIYRRYVAFSRSVSAVGPLGEPKFHLDGRQFVHPWGRPQNDGPALRANGNLAYAEWLLDHDGAAEVHSDLFGDAPSSLIRRDLDYVADHWREKTFDVWEEELADHFYTRAAQAQALRRGARLAERLGDTGTAARYRQVADEISRALEQHWDGRYNLIRSSLNRAGGIQHKWTGLDSAVILAAVHTFGPDSPLEVLDERLLSTAERLEIDFRNKFPVNRRFQLAPAMGRYPEDRYTGQPGQDRDEGGNPWVITTHAFAEYYFRVAEALARASSFAVTEVNRPFLLAALGEPPGSSRLPIGTVLGAGDPRLGRLARAVFDKGDGFLQVVRELVGSGPQREQLDRHTGQPIGAEELSWNYASQLSALRARDSASAVVE
jgi:glucoamylase